MILDTTMLQYKLGALFSKYAEQGDKQCIL